MDFVNFEIAKKLKEKGFREECIAQVKPDNTIIFNHVFDNDIRTIIKCHNKLKPYVDAPTISQVLKWLREEKGFIINVFLDDDSDTPVTYEIYDVNNEIECVRHHHGEYFTIEDWDKASLAGIEYVLDNLIQL